MGDDEPLDLRRRKITPAEFAHRQGIHWISIPCRVADEPWRKDEQAAKHQRQRRRDQSGPIDFRAVLADERGARQRRGQRNERHGHGRVFRSAGQSRQRRPANFAEG